MSNIIIGNITLTSDNAPKVSMKYEYYKSDTNITIGGKKVITINGVISVSDDTGGSLTGSTVMSSLKNIRDIGKTAQCITVSIPSIYSGKARIENVNIEQGSDPTWVNQGAFSIIIEAPLDNIPPNPYGIVAKDRVKSLSFSERVDIGEDAHGFVYIDDNDLSKAYVKFSCKVSVEVDPICDTINNRTLLENVLKKFIKNGPTHRLLQKYQTWRIFLQDRSYTVSDTSAEFSCSSILLSNTSRSQAAYVDLNFEHKKTYDKLEESKVVSGNIKGLVSIPWSDIITLSSSLSSASKLSSAESALSYIHNRYSNISAWSGKEYDLTKYPCPPSAVGGANPCSGTTDSSSQNTDCLKPVSSSVSKNRTEGSIDFSFEWVNTDCKNPNALNIEYQVEDIKAQPTVESFVIPTVGILLQNINCYTARKISFTSTLNFPDNARNCGTTIVCDQGTSLDQYIRDYLLKNSIDINDLLLIEFTLSSTTKSDTLKKGFISVCKTY